MRYCAESQRSNVAPDLIPSPRALPGGKSSMAKEKKKNVTDGRADSPMSLSAAAAGLSAGQPARSDLRRLK